MMFADLKTDCDTEMRRHGKEGRSNTKSAYRNGSNPGSTPAYLQCLNHFIHGCIAVAEIAR